MKYIRTKDGRLLKIVKDEDFDDEEKAKIPNDCTMVYASNMFGCSIISNKNIIKQADTIERLCDEFVLYYLPLEEMSNNESWIPYAQYERLGVWQKMRDEIVDKTLKSKSTLYGAIWTDKGLIYVAKMNENGELELL